MYVSGDRFEGQSQDGDGVNGVQATFAVSRPVDKAELES